MSTGLLIALIVIAVIVIALLLTVGKKARVQKQERGRVEAG